MFGKNDDPQPVLCYRRRSSRIEDKDMEGDEGDDEDAPPSRYEEDWPYAEHYQGDFMEDLELDDMHVRDYHAPHQTIPPMLFHRPA